MLMKPPSARICMRFVSLFCCVFVLWTLRALTHSRKIEKVTRKIASPYKRTHSTPETPSDFNYYDVTNDCEAIIKGDTEQIAILRKSENFPWSDNTTDRQVLELAGNCTALRRRYRFPPFFTPNVTQEEKNFPIAYTMLAHKRVNQILILLSAIYREHNIHCVHLDKKSKPVTFAALERAVRCFPNIVLASERKKVYYAHVSRLEADIVCMKDMLRIQKPAVNWKYLINLCSQDFPLRTNLEIVKQIKMFGGRNGISGHLNISERTRRRTEFVYRLKPSRRDKKEKFVIARTKIKHAPPPHNMTVVKNFAYNIYTRQFLQWALLDGSIGPALLEWSRDTYSPDEHYWLMLNRHPNAPGGSLVPSKSLARTVRWIIKGKPECHGTVVHGICVFGAEDIHEQLKRKQQLFANKFDVTKDSAGPVCIRLLLDERATVPNSFRIDTNPDKSPVKIRPV